MKIQRFDPDEEGYIRVSNLIRPLSFGIIDHRPVLWAIVDPLAKQAASLTAVLKKDGQTVDGTTMPNYRSTLIDNETGEVWHVFEEASRIAQGPALA